MTYPIRHVSATVDVGTTATRIYIRSPGRRVILRKIWVYNSAAADITFYFCASDGTRWTPEIKVLAGASDLFGEVEVPALEKAEDFYAVASATGLRLMIEVEEW